MRYLIDTHIFISLINEDRNIDKRVISDIENPSNEKFISIASLWEIVIKVNIGKLTVTRNLNEMYDLIENLGISILEIQKHQLDKYLTLPLVHRDPFDRLIISQALANDLILITDDQYIRSYPNLKLF
ncbi:type II toxin-antitoxin system VapC family toxin [Pedobacter endophyticus]|uniref:Type II toxin-antitoxin system VapC family toxin n=1 Tax=Pedobacter endophyticus TaxID=2789740 RepID=A0A7S9L2D3_9SPHI|nr:type II toxin-antitoxin system VapC family toxin [Pedobacter endophyticus]QPH41230.1 type II toxin-antitoxin system VapC family toxin [Pedobacter endophyticus]